MKKVVTILLLATLVGAVFVGATIYRSASAATPVAASTNGALSIHKGFEYGTGDETKDADLASALGITVEQLNSATQQANEQALAQAVEAGLITQAQADQLKTSGETFPFGGRWTGWLSQNGIDYQALLASALGISVDELQAAYAKAYNTRIDQAVTDGSLTQEQADLMKGRYALFNNESYKSAMQSAFESAVAQAVSDGVITQAQADLILADNPEAGFPGGRGFGDLDGRHGGMHGGRGGGLPGSQAPATPSTSPSSGG
jgi:hypothetical protein